MQQERMQDKKRTTRKTIGLHIGFGWCDVGGLGSCNCNEISPTIYGQLADGLDGVCGWHVGACCTASCCRRLL
eukprot:3585341-Amphidinium_carterae.1